MSDDSEQSNQDITSPPLSNIRIKILMVFAAIAGSVASWILITPRFGIGVLIGGIMSLISFYWLDYTLGLIIGEAAAGEQPKFLVGRYFARYSAIAAVLVIVYASRVVPVESVLLGLASVAPAVVIEGLIRIFSSFFKREGL